MHFSTPIWAAAALSLSAYGGSTSNEPSAASLAGTSHEARSTGGILRNSNPVRGQYIVVLKQDAVAARDIQDVAHEMTERYRGELQLTYRHALRGFVVSMPEADAQTLAQDPRVAYVEED